MERVLMPCKAAAAFLARHEHEVTVAILTPEGDRLAGEQWEGVEVVEGPEDDVLTRYAMAVQRFNPELVVRVTGDCPMHEATIIGKHVGYAVGRGYDYISNVDPRFRTALDGVDTEVISSRLLVDTHRRATEAADREHVTTLIRRDPPLWARMGFVCGFFDLSDIKLSVDTPEDLERVRGAFDSAADKYHQALRHFGRKDVHRI